MSGVPDLVLAGKSGHCISPVRTADGMIATRSDRGDVDQADTLAELAGLELLKGVWPSQVPG
jgi:hypothetical protein